VQCQELPVEDGREIDAPLFRVALKHRLRTPVFDRDGFCPCCGVVMDIWGDHAITCACGGDRTIRHNAIRDICFDEATSGGLRPEREKAGLFPPRPDADDLPASASAPGQRRPADVWLPRGSRERGEPFDFAVTPALRGVAFRQTADAPEAVFADYKHSTSTQGTNAKLQALLSRPWFWRHTPGYGRRPPAACWTGLLASQQQSGMRLSTP
jgi:hypothetical protein